MGGSFMKKRKTKNTDNVINQVSTTPNIKVRKYGDVNSILILTQLITSVGHDEKDILEKTIKKVYSNSFLMINTPLIEKINVGLTKADLAFLEDEFHKLNEAHTIIWGLYYSVKNKNPEKLRVNAEADKNNFYLSQDKELLDIIDRGLTIKKDARFIIKLVSKIA